MRDKGSGATGVESLGLIRKTQTIETDCNFPRVRVKGRNHLNRLNLGCLAPEEPN